MHRGRTRLPIVGVIAPLAVLTGCAPPLAVPFGGMPVGRGRPISERTLEIGVSVGTLPEMMGTLPALRDEYDSIINPIPDPDHPYALREGAPPIVITLGGNRIDLGYNAARGPHAVIRVLGGEHWAASVSPAIYVYRDKNPRHGVTSFNLNGLFSVDPWPSGRWVTDLYAGAGINRYKAWIENDLDRVSHTVVIPSILAGVRVGIPVCLVDCDHDDMRRLILATEAGATWITQRNGRRDLVPTVRVFISYGSRPRPPPGG